LLQKLLQKTRRKAAKQKKGARSATQHRVAGATRVGCWGHPDATTFETGSPWACCHHARLTHFVHLRQNSASNGREAALTTCSAARATPSAVPLDQTAKRMQSTMRLDHPELTVALVVEDDPWVQLLLK